MTETDVFFDTDNRLGNALFISQHKILIITDTAEGYFAIFSFIIQLYESLLESYNKQTYISSWSSSGLSVYTASGIL